MSCLKSELPDDNELCSPNGSRDEVDVTDALFEEVAPETFDTFPAVPDSAYDPDHLNPAKGGNKASDDYW